MEAVTPSGDSKDELTTQLIHHPYQPPAGFEAVPVGVQKASTVLFPSVQAVRSRDWKDKSGYTYGLHGTPTTFTLEERLATLEGGLHCVLAPSGLSALTLVNMALLRAGDEVLLPENVYGPNLAFAEVELERWGIRHRVYNPMESADLAAKLSPATRLVWLEAAGSVTLEFPDLTGLVECVQQHNKRQSGARPVLTALDNTWGAGVAFRPFDFGIDISVQALTKYPSGGADVLMGSVVTRDPHVHRSVLLCHMRLGLGVGANDVELVLRGLPTLSLRYQAQDRATRALAEWMQRQPHVAAVLHPALPESPGHAHWLRHAQAAAALFSVVFEPSVSVDQVDGFCNALRLFRLGYSWAGPMSLCMPYEVSSLRPPRAFPGSRVLVRFAVGLESLPDLQADLALALRTLD